MFRRVLFAALFLAAISPAQAGNLLVTIDIERQQMQVRIDGVTRHVWDVSTGRVGFETPPGRFQPIRMHKKYFSKTYDNAPMPYAVFFHGGYAIHGTTALDRLGSVASHGCVRLDPANAKALFALVQQAGMLNTVIRVREAATGLTDMDDPKAPAGKSVELAAAGNLKTVLIDEQTTASIGTVKIDTPDLRPGLDG
ncbi:MAG TPA: L,D-transpeptidase [Devosia sp.]|nr:L,D-transpeptidase [Devosia sp.]